MFKNMIVVVILASVLVGCGFAYTSAPTSRPWSTPALRIKEATSTTAPVMYVLAKGKLGRIEGAKTTFQIKLGDALPLDYEAIPYAPTGVFVNPTLCHYGDGSEVYADSQHKIVGLNKVGVCTGELKVTFYSADGNEAETLSAQIIITIIPK